MNTTPPTECKAWTQLAGQAESWRTVHLRELFGADAQSRAQRSLQFTTEAAGVRFDYSRQRLGAMTLRLLSHLAEERGLAEWRDALLSGKVVNSTENPPAGHTAPPAAPPPTAVAGAPARQRAPTQPAHSGKANPGGNTG